MSTKFFLDTNLLAYSFDWSAPVKKKKAERLIEKALAGGGIISWQVVQEFLNLALGKFKKRLEPDDARAYLDRVLIPLCEIYPSSDIYRQASEIAEETGYSFYDSLVIAAALNGGCGILYSEDLQDGREFQDLVIRNPFKD